MSTLTQKLGHHLYALQYSPTTKKFYSSEKENRPDEFIN